MNLIPILTKNLFLYEFDLVIKINLYSAIPYN